MNTTIKVTDENRRHKRLGTSGGRPQQGSGTFAVALMYHADTGAAEQDENVEQVVRSKHKKT